MLLIPGLGPQRREDPSLVHPEPVEGWGLDARQVIIQHEGTVNIYIAGSDMARGYGGSQTP